MNGPIAQYVALTCQGNAYLNGLKVEPLLDTNSTCQFCEEVKFEIARKLFFVKRRNVEAAGTPNEWFRHIESLGAYGIRLSCSPQEDAPGSDRMSAGFIGGGRIWLMEVVLPKDQSEYWLAQWRPGNTNSPQRRVWKVAYVRVGRGTTPDVKRPDVTDVIAQLVRSLREIHTFAQRQGVREFTRWFEEALDTIDSKGTRFHGYHRDLAPKGLLSGQAATVLDACQRAWVFGGMGSWNDMTFDGDARIEYERVSEQLFESVNQAIAAGTNTSFGG